MIDISMRGALLSKGRKHQDYVWRRGYKPSAVDQKKSILNQKVTPFAIPTGSCSRRMAVANAFVVTENVPKMTFNNEKWREIV